MTRLLLYCPAEKQAGDVTLLAAATPFSRQHAPRQGMLYKWVF